MKVDNPIKTSSGWIHQTSARMVWPNAGLVIAVSAFGIRKGFWFHRKINMQRTQSQFQALQKFVNRTFFYSRLLFAIIFAIDAVACWNQAGTTLGTERHKGTHIFEQ